MDILKKIKETIEHFHMLFPEDKIIIGVSGGPDSVVLLHSLNQLKDEYKVHLHIAHLNHLLRGEDADEDAQFVSNLGRQMGIPCTVWKEDVANYAREYGISLEQAGREKRYAFFTRLMDEVGANRIAVGHNLNDQAETVLERLIRGGGLKGLGGIEPVRQNNIIRPLIRVSRAEIETYIDKHRLPYRIDQTNLEPVYFRNRIRMELIPVLQEQYNPQIVSLLAQTADILREDESYMAVMVEQLVQKMFVLTKPHTVKIPLASFLALHKALKRRLIRRGIEMLKGDLKGFSYAHVESVIELAGKNEGYKVLSLPYNVCIEKDYNHLCISLKITVQDTLQKKRLETIDINISGRTEIPFAKMAVVAKIIDYDRFNMEMLDKNSDCVYLDYKKINGLLQARPRQPGDRFQPLGMEGTKKLKDYFIDRKIPREERDVIPIIVNEPDIIWVVGYQIDARYQVTSKTQEILMLQVERKEA